MTRAAAFALAVLVTACGGPDPHVEPHGLDVAVLAASPHGEPVRVGRSLEPGTRSARAEVSWTIVRAGEAPREGHATFRLEQVTRRTTEGLRSVLTVHVASPQGEARHLVRGLDGLQVAYDHAKDGRLRRPTLRFLTPAPPDARRLLDGLWLAGFGPGRPWIPARPLREGETWSREELGGLGEAARLGLAEELPPTTRGGARLDAVEAGEARVVLEALVSMDGTIRQAGERAAMSLGVLDRGRAAIDVASGLPRTWHYEQVTRLHYDDGRERRSVDVVQRVEGRLLDAGTGEEARDG